MMLGIARALEAHGMGKSRIKFDLFSTGRPGRAKHVAASAKTASGAMKTRISIKLDGATRTFEADKNVTILDAALRNSLYAPEDAGKAGVCSAPAVGRSSRAKPRWPPTMRSKTTKCDWGTSVVPVKAYPVSDRIVVDYDQ